MHKTSNKKIKIAIFSQPEYFRFHYETDLNSFANVFEFKAQEGLSLEDMRPLIKFKADYNFFFRGEFLPDGLLESLNGISINLSTEPFPRLLYGKIDYTIDSINRYLFFRKIRFKPFDYVFHYDKHTIPILKWDRLFVSGSIVLPIATDTFKKINCRKEREIFFIGRSTAHREIYFGYLKHKYNFLHIAHGIWGKELITYICSSKICLNIHAENEASWEPRLQMLLACGAFVISEKIIPNHYLRPGIDFIQVNSPLELNEKIQYYLKHEKERLLIADSGRRRVNKILNSKNNFYQLILDIENNKYPKYKAGKGRFFVDLILKVINLVKFSKELIFLFWSRFYELCFKR